MEFTKDKILSHFNYHEFVPFLAEFYKREVQCPERNHIDFEGKHPGTMLLMPSWQTDEFIGVKIVTVFPENEDQASIHGTYLLMDGKTGSNIASFDGLALTCKRTAAVSALAANVIARQDVNSFLMIGSGNMSTELVMAHCAVRQYEEIKLWGRNYDRANEKADWLTSQGFATVAIEDKNKAIGEADLISCATLSKEPLVHGDLVKAGTHVDLVGSYQKDAREADDQLMMKSKIYVDTWNALHESGDLFIPLQYLRIEREAILNDLPSICRQGFAKRSMNDITTFKSVGFGVSDLAAAVYLAEKFQLIDRGN